MLARQLEDHTRLSHLADRLEHELCEACPADLSDLAHVRWALARELLLHLAIEDRVLRADMPSRLAGDPTPAGLRAHLHDHLVRWSGDAIVRGWQDYRVATIKLLAAMRARLAHERRRPMPQVGWA